MTNYCVLFSGEIHEDFELDDVISNFKSHLSLSEEQLKHFFSGNEVLINSHLTQNEALALVAELEEIGGICYFLHKDDVYILPDDVLADRRNEQQRKTKRRYSFRSGIFSDRRNGADRRQLEYLYA